MATINSTGQAIPERQISEQEQIRLRTLSVLSFPKHRKVIESLSDYDFKMWIYGMNPLIALQLSATRKFGWMMKRRNNWFQKILRKFK